MADEAIQQAIYLDNNATTRPSAGVVEAVTRALTEYWQNPSSVHRAGQAARRQVELARSSLAELIGARARDLVLTGSGTEAIDLAIRGTVEAWEGARRRNRVAKNEEPPPPRGLGTPSAGAEGDELAEGEHADRSSPVGRTAGGTPAPPLSDRKPRGARSTDLLEDSQVSGTLPVIVTTKIEHAAVRDLVEDLEKTGRAEVRWAPIMAGGAVDVGGLARILDEAAGRVAIASVQWANNETGAVQPVREIARLCRERGVTFHCDATQWVGKMEARVGVSLDAPLEGLDASLVTFSPHKFHGPKGVGVLWSARGVRLRPVIHGSQELGRRGGTENVPGIVGAGVAAREALEWLKRAGERERLAGLRDRFERGVVERVPDAVVNGPGAAARLWNTTNIGFPRLEAEALLLLLSERGVCASAGAACSSGSLEPSPVLLAMGVREEVAHGSLRFSLSRETTEEEIDRAVIAVAEAVERLRKSG